MNMVQVELAAAKLHQNIWVHRAVIWPEGCPGAVSMLDPRAVATRVLGLQYEVRQQITGDQSRQRGAFAGGFFDRGRGIIGVSDSFSEEVQRFTAAHEIGHVILHPWVGDKVIHRDMPVSSTNLGPRSMHEKEADFFAACFLLPRKLLAKAFAFRFGSSIPLRNDETTGFYLSAAENLGFFSANGDSLRFASMVARAESFGQQRFDSLATCFRVSVRAMAIRIQELGFVAAG